MKQQPPQRLPLDISKIPKLDIKQAGHLRHYHNLAWQLDGEWRHMGTQEPAQEFLDAYRYQISAMAYGAGVAHFHRLPALRSVFKPLLRRLIHKMLRREVWGYWFNTSHSGNKTDPDRKELRKPWADPVVRENIMYSGHLLLMTSLYAMLFDDNEFEKPLSLTFCWDPLFWGLGTEVFSYDNRSLQAAIIAEMEKNNWIGVCCEPNLVFIVCNQFPLVGMRYNDVRDGTNVVGDVLKKYKEAWERKQMVASNGLYVDWWYVNQDRPEIPKQVGFTAGANAFMNTWNPKLVRSAFERQAFGYITNFDGEVRLNSPTLANVYREIAGDDAGDKALLLKALEIAKTIPPPKFPFSLPTLGYVVEWLSELGKSVELEGLLEYADTHLNPTWENGGLFYPRNDQAIDESHQWRHMDRFTGNAAIGYARLNVNDGQKIMWDRPWTRDILAKRPWIDGVDLSQGVDFLRGQWESEESALILTMKTWDGSVVELEPTARNLEEGTWAVYVAGELQKCVQVTDTNSFTFRVAAGADEVDVIIIKVQ
ncbi:linalool dehydratase/isomerase [Aspergillus awamori]|uniref:Linalool dehydratase/isomerase n=1 Tax=Aspergillus awamori TaxID=105351 RepID=A0A401KD01_ASPAW|nr:linalool dehydratase/isomerase [Aspergillus awamori]GKZ61424.1 hypothetical protein AnigIFM49718_008140 [Aspergillus niger]